MTVVVDATVAVTASLDRRSPRLLDHSGLIAPPLLWSETCAALRRMAWRGEIGDDEGRDALARLTDGTITQTAPSSLYAEATRVARRLGWAKTYDAEYVALAQLRRCPLVTRDFRLARRVGSLVKVIGPADL